MKGEKNKKTLTKKGLFENIRKVVLESRNNIVRNINHTLLFTYYQIGLYIVENEQKGEKRAKYASGTISYLSIKLTNEFGKGFTERNLELMRKFYSIYSNRISYTEQKRESSSIVGIPKSPISKSVISEFALSWTHYTILMKIKSKKERDFYESETTTNNWSVRQLQREYNSSLYERVALSNKNQIAKKTNKTIANPISFLKEPYILEFLDLKEEHSYTESELEEAIINRIEKFLKELGSGFLFDSRQKRISFDGDDFYVDLVFYNRLLKSFVLIDLKIGKLMHQDIGQMQMYVNYYDRKIKTKDENKTIGIILCKESNKAVVEYTLPEDNKQIFSREYKLYLPSKSDLQKLLQN